MKSHALLIDSKIIVLSLFFFNHCHSYIAVYFLEMFFITCLLNFLIKFYANLWRLQLIWQCIEAGCLWQ